MLKINNKKEDEQKVKEFKNNLLLRDDIFSHFSPAYIAALFPTKDQNVFDEIFSYLEKEKNFLNKHKATINVIRKALEASGHKGILMKGDDSDSQIKKDSQVKDSGSDSDSDSDSGSYSGSDSGSYSGSDSGSGSGSGSYSGSDSGSYSDSDSYSD